MAAKGTESKKIIFNKLQELFSNSFFEEEDKILRIPLDENGTRVEIKVTLTAAKNNLGEGGTTPLSAFSNDPVSNVVSTPATEELEPTQEEKDNVSKLLASLGL